MGQAEMAQYFNRKEDGATWKPAPAGQAELALHCPSHQRRRDARTAHVRDDEQGR
jgi:hypothetical protein